MIQAAISSANLQRNFFPRVCCQNGNSNTGTKQLSELSVRKIDYLLDFYKRPKLARCYAQTLFWLTSAEMKNLNSNNLYSTLPP